VEHKTNVKSFKECEISNTPDRDDVLSEESGSLDSSNSNDVTTVMKIFEDSMTSSYFILHCQFSLV
jgi:hypothetical protein